MEQEPDSTWVTWHSQGLTATLNKLSLKPVVNLLKKKTEINQAISSPHFFNLDNQNESNKTLSTKYHIMHNNMYLKGYIKWEDESGKLRELEVMAQCKITMETAFMANLWGDVKRQ